MLFGFNEKGRFVRLNKPILPGNDIEWVHIFEQLDLQDSLRAVAVDRHPARQLVPKATNVFLRESVREDSVRVPTPERAQHAAGSMVGRRLLVESKTAQGRRKNRGNRTGTRGNPQAGRTTVLGFLSELNRDSADSTRIEHMDDGSEYPSCFRTASSAMAMLDCSPVSGGQFLLD